MKIWKEWEKINRYYFQLIIRINGRIWLMESVQFKYNNNRKGYWTFGFINSKKFNTYHQAIVYTQRNILKEFQKIKIIMESK